MINEQAICEPMVSRSKIQIPKSKEKLNIYKIFQSIQPCLCFGWNKCLVCVCRNHGIHTDSCCGSQFS